MPSKITELIRQHNINEARRKTDQELSPTSVGQEMSSKPPWYDEGEDVVVDQQVAPDVIGQPMEVYYYEPFTGYGYIRFFKDSIGFKFPGGSGYTQGLDSLGLIDFDGDGVADPVGTGCCLLIGIISLFRWVTRWATGHSKEIKWSSHIPYQDIQEISLYGRSVEVLRSTGKPRKLKIRVGKCDGERLYRELFIHYSPAISRWEGTWR